MASCVLTPFLFLLLPPTVDSLRLRLEEKALVALPDDVKSIVLDSVVEDAVLADLVASFFLVLFPGFPQSKHWVAESSSLSYVQ